jgi:uncharacterized membrane protein
MMPNAPDPSRNTPRDMSAETSSEGDTLRRRAPLVWWLTLIGPPLAVLFLLVWIAWMGGALRMRQASLVLLATFFFFGRFVILGGADPQTAAFETYFTSLELAGFVFFLDLMTAIVISFHAGLLFRLPYLGNRLLLLAQQGQSLVEAQPWMRRMTVVGVVLFVMLPIAATGSIGGSFLGRLLGLGRRRTLLSVMMGSAAGCLAMYFGADLIHRYVDRDDPLVFTLGVGVIVALILLLNARYRRLVRR